MPTPKLFDEEILKTYEVGTVVKIVSEFDDPTKINPKFKGFIMGRIDLDGKTYLHSLNKTSYAKISETFGRNTKEWIGKEIVFAGEKKMGNMLGKLWEAKA